MGDHSVESRNSSPSQIDGISLNTGIGIGRAVLHSSAATKLAFDRSTLRSDLGQGELGRLHQALAGLVDEIKTLISRQLTSKTLDTSSQTKSESRDILDVYLMLANDPGWRRQLTEKVKEGMAALEAIDQTLQSIRDKLMEKGEASLWQARISDFEDLSSRLKRYLIDPARTPEKKNDDSAIIVIADRIGPAELLDYDRGRLAGLVLVEQSQISHVAIVARSLKIPVVGVLNSAISNVIMGDSILVDGNEGRVYIHPSKEVINGIDWETLPRKTHSFDPILEHLIPLSAQTLDGVSLSLHLNAGLVEDVDYIESAGAEGVGLYRTEISFMMRPKLPNVAEQTKLYRDILHRAGNYPVVFRTLDVGGDKVIPYLERLKTENFAQDERITRVFFDRPILMRYQLRALIRACAGVELSIMLPMIAEIEEVKEARKVLDDEVAREQEKGNSTPTKIRLGAMIEVPSLAYQLPDLFHHVDFLSVGSNDLFRFYYAIDREYRKLANRYDVLSPIFLKLLKSIRDQCAFANVPLSICGEMAGQPLEALALIGLGYRNLSMSAAAVPLIKGMIRSLNYKQVCDYMDDVCGSSHSSIRQNLRHFAKGHNIYID